MARLFYCLVFGSGSVLLTVALVHIGFNMVLASVLSAAILLLLSNKLEG